MNEQLVLEAAPVNWGHDATLNQSNLALDPERRIRKQAVRSGRMKEIRGAHGERVSGDLRPAPRF